VTWQSNGPDEPDEGWRWQRRFSGENVMALGIVYEAMARWLGAATAVSAATRLDPGDGAIDVPDHVLAILAFPDDVTATIEMSARTHPIASNTATFFGTHGALEVDFASQRIRTALSGAGWTDVEIRDDDRAGWTAEIDFIASIRDGAPVTLTDFATGAHYMAVVEAIDRSAASGLRHSVEAIEP
jgi:predicted dehydrogenase